MRKDSTTGDWYACSGHFLWVGERTRQLDGAHVEFLSGLHNPIGAKVGPTMTPDELVALAERLNPDRMPGRLTLITRLGASRVQELLPPLLRAVREAEIPVVWVCDPMHANGFVTGSGHKTRRLDDVLREIEGFFAAHREVGHLARRRPPRDHRRGRDGVPRRLRGRARGAARHAVRIALRPALERASVARPRVPGRRADARARAHVLRNITVVGTGLIGASAALAARRGGRLRARLGSRSGRAPRRAASARRSTRSRRSRTPSTAPTSSSSRRPSPSFPTSCARCSPLAPERLRRHRRRLDEERGLRRGRRRRPLHRRPSDLRRRDARPRARERRALRGRDLVPDADRGHRARSCCARCTASSPRSARGRSRSTPAPTTGSSRSRATCRTRSPTSCSTRPARRASTATIRCRRRAARCAT